MQPTTAWDAARAAVPYARSARDAWRGSGVRLGAARLEVPGTRRIRLSVVGGNLHIHRLIDAMVGRGDTVVDVGANIGYNAVYAAMRVGRSGRVVAVEPTPDNLRVLERNLAAAGASNVAVVRAAAGRERGPRALYVRGETSAVNSLFEQSCYARVTEVLEVPVERLDDLVEDAPRLVKIDVEGAELDVLEGMPRLLGAPRLALVVEWHPALQSMAGYAPDALPRWLLERGWRLHSASHWSLRPLDAAALPALTARLQRRLGPVELLAQRA